MHEVSVKWFQYLNEFLSWGIFFTSTLNTTEELVDFLKAQALNFRSIECEQEVFFTNRGNPFAPNNILDGCSETIQAPSGLFLNSCLHFMH